MGYFNRDGGGQSSSRGRSNFGRDDRGGRGGGFSRGGGDRQMHKTICSNCGKGCEVPFRPTSGKPVYCSECFEKMGGRNSDGGRSDRPERNRSDFGPRPQTQTVDYKESFDFLNAKLDKIIELLTSKKEEITIKEVKLPKTPKISKAKKVKVAKEDK